MQADQIRIIRANWEEIHPNARLAGRLFYTKLFLIDPALGEQFRADADERTQRLMRALGIAVYGLGQPKVLMPLLRNVAEQHVDWGVQGSHYDSVGKALMWTLKIVLGDKFTEEARHAWESLYGTITRTLREAGRGHAPMAADLRAAA